ncbi:alginate lyase family protein [Erwinia tasmaniensis]|uniref:Exported protein n=1 Tax=Erwinia tasmaniensis (strain DSM 17950 / CFBP 7177 / CIP 109463 / NCPPB 4357 / Et1/99) TaxID=465817 RepID=B2VCL0_ERWT9|nr:alginate lyase family protein [Erwinia tasmaniensis]CAO98430.1 Putative exported protein [Erwinia tasmaniensis Et1/99]
MQSVLCRIVLLLLTGFFSLALGAQEYAFLHRHELALNKRLLQQQQAPDLTVAAWRRLRVQADRDLTLPLLSVTDKKLTPPGGSQHDYYSLSAYWWPDNLAPDGLPWLRRDGEVNPASKNGDSDGVRLAEFTARVQTLTLAWYFSDDERYARRAIALIRRWFISPSTRMDPNLTFAQMIPGRASARRSGVLDGRYFATRIVDSLIMLRLAPGWRAEDEKQMQRWMNDYLYWLLNSRQGRSEARAENNHGSWYNVQVAGIAWYLQRPQVIKQMVQQATGRMNSQFAADGSQPKELARTRSFHYSWFNLQALTALAGLARHGVGEDLWHYRTTQQVTLLKALDFMVPFSDGRQRWPWRSLDPIGVRLIPLLSQADNQLGSDRYQQAIRQTAWTLPERGAARGAMLDAQRDCWLLSQPRFSIHSPPARAE